MATSKGGSSLCWTMKVLVEKSPTKQNKIMCKNRQCCHKALCQLESIWSMNKSLLCSRPICLWKISFYKEISVDLFWSHTSLGKITSLVSMKLLLIYTKNEIWTRPSNLRQHVQSELFFPKINIQGKKKSGFDEKVKVSETTKQAKYDELYRFSSRTVPVTGRVPTTPRPRVTSPSSPLYQSLLSFSKSIFMN